MKKTLSISAFGLFVAFALTLFAYSCKKDDSQTDLCANTVCEHGTAVAGTNSCSCACDSGYYGADCSQNYRTAFLDASGGATTWASTDDACVVYGPNSSYHSTFSADPSKGNLIVVSNFEGYNNASFALHVANSELYSDRDTFSSYDSIAGAYYYIYDYHGTLDQTKTRITYTYKYSFTTHQDSCSGTLDKQ